MAWYSTREEAAEAEENAIWDEQPTYNRSRKSAANRSVNRRIRGSMRQEFLAELAAAYEAGEDVQLGFRGTIKLTPENRAALSK